MTNEQLASMMGFTKNQIKVFLKWIENDGSIYPNAVTAAIYFRELLENDDIRA